MHFFVEKLAKKKATFDIFLKDLEDAKARFNRRVSKFFLVLFALLVSLTWNVMTKKVAEVLTSVTCSL